MCKKYYLVIAKVAVRLCRYSIISWSNGFHPAVLYGYGVKCRILTLVRDPDSMHALMQLLPYYRRINLMDIYEVERQEGRYLARELEKLRRKKQKGRVVVRCSAAGNEVLTHFRKSFLLDYGISDILERAQQYYISIGGSALTLTLLYDACHIRYHLREETDWKYVELELADSSLVSCLQPTKSHIAGRAEVTAFHILVNHSITYGFHNAFRNHSGTFLTDVFEQISAADELKKAEFGLDAKVTSLILKMI